MERLTDKLMLFACCLAAAIAFAPRAATVAVLLVCATAAIAVEVADMGSGCDDAAGVMGDDVAGEIAGSRSLRGSSDGGAVSVLRQCVPTALPLACCALALALPETLLALPLAAYDLARRPPRALIAVPFTMLLVGINRAGLDVLPIVFAAFLSAAAVVLARRTDQTRRQRDRNLRERDRLRERSFKLEAQNRDLVDKRELAVRVAVLEERTRIAREIHDNVGHLLTRTLLQAKAYEVVFASDERARTAFSALANDVDEALGTVRASVRDLHEDRIDAGAQVARIAAEAPVPTHCTTDVAAAPPEVASCLAAVTREALSNVAHHAGPSARAEVSLVEHPGFWQLTVTDDGGAAPGVENRAAVSSEAGAPATASGDAVRNAPLPEGRPPATAPYVGRGLGLTSMEERVDALGGTFRAGPDAAGYGWRVFASIPKPRGATVGGNAAPRGDAEPADWADVFPNDLCTTGNSR